MRKNNNKTLKRFYLLFVLSLAILTTAQSPPPFEPVDHITLSCGSHSSANSLGRIWNADTSSKFQLIDEANASIASSASPQFTQIDSAPYRTARLSRSQFTYIFPVTSGPKFIRLYFYPAYYAGINCSNVFFSVQAGAYTLVSNFSVTLHAQALQLPAFYKEFCLNVEQDQRLNLTFTPTADMRDAYALVNAIEILSMPQNLYYTAEGDPGIYAIDQTGVRLRIDNTTAMELMYRLNVGGTAVGPSDDTGLFRNWENDEEYLVVDASSTQPANTSIDLKYTSNAKICTAPKMVYQTARSMGSNKTINDQYYLTWEFEVDSTFSYFVRLHFCEFQPPIQKQGDRDFQIWIANMSAEAHADVIYWSGGNGIPTYRDYAVIMGAVGKEKFQKLYIALHTNPARFTAYSDAILNGLEIFKLNNYFNLAGPNPEATLVSPPNNLTPSQDSTNSKGNKKTITTIVGSALSGFVALSLLLFFILRRRLKVKYSAFSDSTKSNTAHGRSALPSDLCRHFSLAEIIESTDRLIS